MITLGNCPACDSRDAKIVVSLNDDRRQRFLVYSKIKYGGLLDTWLDELPPVIMQCGACGHCWYRHQPDADRLTQMYAAGRRLLPDVKLTREPSAAMIEEMERLRGLLMKAAPPRLLDFGSGYGRWARAATIAGFTVTAFEPSVVRAAEELPPFELVHDLDLIQGRHFAAIQLEQVLEHVGNPMETLYDLHQFCTDTTVVRITVPNILRPYEGPNLWAAWPYDGKRTHTMAPFEHLHGFTPRSLDCLLSRAGFKLISPARLLRHYPKAFLRSVAQDIFPSIGGTHRLVLPS